MAERTKHIHAQRAFRFLAKRHKTLANWTLAKRLVGETTGHPSRQSYSGLDYAHLKDHVPLLMKWLLDSKLSQFSSIIAPILLIDYVRKRNSVCVVNFLENVFRRLLEGSAALWREWKILKIYLQTTKIWLGPGLDAELFISRTKYVELSTWKVRRLNQSGTPISIWNGWAVLPASPGWEFRLWNVFDSDVELFMYRTKCIGYYKVFCK